MNRDRRAQVPEFPFIALGLAMYLLSVLADAVSLAGLPGPWDVVALASMAAGCILAVRAALPAVEDLLWLRRSLSPARSGVLATYAAGAAVLWFLSLQLREDNVAVWQPMLLTVAAFFALLAFGRSASDRNVDAGRRPAVDLSATQRIARASLDF